MKKIIVEPGQSISLHRHFHRSEHWVVTRGTAEVTQGERTFLLQENSSVFIQLGEAHRLHNPGRMPLVIVEIQTGSYLGEDDIERFDDEYGRDLPPPEPEVMLPAGAWPHETRGGRSCLLPATYSGRQPRKKGEAFCLPFFCTRVQKLWPGQDVADADPMIFHDPHGLRVYRERELRWQMTELRRGPVFQQLVVFAQTSRRAVA